MDIVNFVPGFIYDPVRAADVTAERIAKGQLVFASQQNQLAGSCQRLRDSGVTFFSMRDAEVTLLGRHRRPFLQKRGTCVSRGFARGLQCSLDYAIARLGKLLIACEVSFAPIYSMARIDIGRGRCGYGDGAILADAAQAVQELGCATIDLFKGLTEDQVEQLACKYAAPGMGTPREWLEASKLHTADTFAPETIELLFDCIAAGYAVPYGNGYVTAMPDQNGLSRLGSSGAHCRCFTGFYVDKFGNLQLISSESWGRYPAGQPQQTDQTIDVSQIPCIIVQTIAGPRVLAPGDVGVDARQFFSACQNGGEMWAVGAPRFEGDSIADLLKTQNAA